MATYFVWLIAFIAGIVVSYFVPEATIPLKGKFIFLGAWGTVLGFVLYTLCRRRIDNAEAEFNDNLNALKESKLKQATGEHETVPPPMEETEKLDALTESIKPESHDFKLPNGAMSIKDALEKMKSAPISVKFPLKAWKAYSRSALKNRPFKEVLENLEKLLPEMFPQASGILYMYAGNQSELRKMFSFGKVISDDSILPGECASYNAGDIVVADYSNGDLSGGCTHLHHRPQGVSFCAPIEGSEEHFGLLSVQVDALPDNESMDDWHAKVSFVATTFGLYVANQNLDVRYREHTIRDNLTGLFNKRYMEESLVREVAAANRHHSSIGLVMLYPDQINEIQKARGRHGVEQLLWELGQRLPSYIRTEDIPCRYDGNVFCVILPSADLRTTRQRAEKIRNEIAQLNIAYGEGVLATTLSIGVAVLPSHASDKDGLLYMAQASMKQSLQMGGNRVTIADAVMR